MGKAFRRISWILFLVLVSCAVITVNIYFPEKDVKEAYKALEKELMTPAAPGQEMKPKPEGKQGPASKFEWIASAYAQESGMADNIAQIIKKMPDVVNAYKEMGARLPETDRLRDSGALGEGNNGLLTVRDEKGLGADGRRLMDMENANRSTVINGMTKAIVRINRVPENEANLNQVRPQATEQFAALRRDSAKNGWWIQDKNGNWAKK